jgi:hypothetical protein
VCVYFAPKDWANGQREVLLDVSDPKFWKSSWHQKMMW